MGNITDTHKDIFGDRSAIVNNALSTGDIQNTVTSFQKYLFLLEHNADYEHNKGMGFKYDILNIEIEATMKEAMNHGWNYQHLCTMDNLLFEANKFKTKLEAIQVVDPEANLTYDDGYG